MNYHNIEHDNMLNGEGLRVVIFFSGCDMQPKCKGCHNSIAWDKDSGIEFDKNAWLEICEQLDQDYISGITLLGGEPLAYFNRDAITELVKEIKKIYPHKTVWCYTGYTFDKIKDLEIIQYIDVLIDGPFIKELADIKCKYAGSSNQRVIDVQQSLDKNKIVLYNV